MSSSSEILDSVLLELIRDNLDLNYTQTNFNQLELKVGDIHEFDRQRDLDLVEIKSIIEIVARSFGHDIANPLTAISINIDYMIALVNDLEDDKREALLETLHSNKKQIKKINSIIEQIRYNKLETVDLTFSFDSALNYLRKFVALSNAEPSIYCQTASMYENISIIQLYILIRLIEISPDITIICDLKPNDNRIIGIYNIKNDRGRFDVIDLNSITIENTNVQLLEKFLPKYNYEVDVSTVDGLNLIDIYGI